MRNDNLRHNRPVSGHVHRLVYAAVVGLAFWFALAAWSGFAGDGYTNYLLVVVSGFIVVAVGLPSILSWVGRANQSHDVEQTSDGSFQNWAAGDVDTATDRLKGSNAAIEILLPLAAAAFGMTAIGVVLHFAAHGVV